MVVHADKDNAFSVFHYLSLSLMLCTIQLYVFLVIFPSYKRKSADKRVIPRWKSNDLSQFFLIARVTAKQKDYSESVGFLQLINGLCHLHQKEGMLLLLPTIQPMLLLYKAEYVEVVLSGKNFKKGYEYHFVKDWFKDSIFGKNVQKWRHARKISTPAFHTRLLDKAMIIVNKKAKLLNEKLCLAMKSDQQVDIAWMMDICTLDIICEAGMGSKKEEKSIIAFANAWRKYKELVAKRVCSPWLWPDMLYFKTEQGKEAKSCIKLMEIFDREMVVERNTERFSQLEENIKNNDTCKKINNQLCTETDGKNEKNSTILDILLNHHFLNENFTLEDVSKEIDVFIIGGSDTVAASASWAIYMLGLYPGVQQKVHEELDRILGEEVEKEITRDDIKELKYLECVMKETRRLFPPIPYTGRVLEEDTVIGNYLVPKGTTCVTSIYMLHRDPDVFPNPEAFYPERFLENTKRNPYAFIPFLAGPRNCIGQRFGVLETIILVANVLRRFEVKSLLPLDKIFINLDVTLGTDNGLPVTFRDRCRNYEL